MTDTVKRTERGWVGHYICGHRCRFRRNTLLEYKDKKWVVSTVGGLVIEDKFEPIGLDRWFETMAFVAKEQDGYIDADVSQEIYFESEWGIWGNSWEEVIATYPNVDNVANDMHEKVVEELMAKMKDGAE